MNSRERIEKALRHEQPDKLPIDFGATLVTGIHVSMVYKIRQYYGLDEPGIPVKVIEPYQMLGEIKPDLRNLIGIDVVNLDDGNTIFGYSLDEYRKWKFHDGTPLLIPKLFNTNINNDGTLYQYPKGDKNSSPCAKMPKKGFFFDSIIRQNKIDEKNLNPEDNLEEFNLLSDSDLDYLKEKVDYLNKNTQCAIMGNVISAGFGDIAFVPGPSLSNPKGIRDIEEWYISIFTRKEYIKKVFEGQCELAIENCKRIFNKIGNKIDIIFISGTDFGMQEGPFISKETFRELFKPFYKKVNTWIHENTSWKCFTHSCGSVYELIPDLIEAGFDILNPVQISARNMDPAILKKEFGKYITFWGGGINTQKTLPFGNPKTVAEEVKKLIEIFNKDGGYVFSAVHYIQANSPLENVVAMIETIRKYRQ